MNRLHFRLAKIGIVNSYYLSNYMADNENDHRKYIGVLLLGVVLLSQGTC